MISFEANDISKWMIELEIMNSNPDYNLLSKNKRSISIEDIHAEYDESKELNTTRLLIKQEEHYIGLVDYCLRNRTDNNPWISLFVIHRQFQGGGNSAAAYQQVEQLIRQEAQGKIRLAVHKENVKGIEFCTEFR